MDLRIVRTIGTTEPVTLAEVKNYLRLNNTQDDDLINDIIVNARLRAERYLNSDIVSKQRTVYVGEITDPINLYYAPVTTVDSVTVDGEALTVDQDYYVRGFGNPLIEFEGAGPRRIVQITYTTSGLNFIDIKQGILALCAELYYGRTEKYMTNWRSFLSPFKVNGFYGTR